MGFGQLARCRDRVTGKTFEVQCRQIGCCAPEYRSHTFERWRIGGRETASINHHPAIDPIGWHAAVEPKRLLKRFEFERLCVKPCDLHNYFIEPTVEGLAPVLV